MELVSEAVGAIAEQVAVLSKAADELSHRELIGLLSELTTVLRSVPVVEHKVLARLMDETEPSRLGEASSWKKVLTTALRVSGAEAERRLRRAKMLGPRRAMTGEPLAPVWEATAAAQALGLVDEEHIKVIAAFHKNLPAWVDADTRAHADRQLAGKGAGMSPEELDEAAGRLLLMIDQDGPEPTEQERARKRWVKIGKQQRDGSSKISGYIDAETRAYLDAALAKDAAPGANMPAQEPAGTGRGGRAVIGGGGPGYPYPGAAQSRRPQGFAAPQPGIRGIGHPQRVTGDGDRVDHAARTGEGRRGRGHRRRITATDAGSDPDGR